jgi:PAS domain S-box-containing protein
MFPRLFPDVEESTAVLEMGIQLQYAKESSPLQFLLVGDREEDFFIIQDLLGRTPGGLIPRLDHVRTFEDALACLDRDNYELILFQHEPEDGICMRLLRALRERGATIPFIFLSEQADEATIADLAELGACDWVGKSELNEASLSRAIRYATNLHHQELQNKAAEQMLTKLLRAVEQSADLVMITNREGVIEYVNPAFEALTGYQQEEVIGQTPRLLKSGQQDPALYRELWETILAGNVFRGVLANRRKSGELYYVEKTISPVRDAEGSITHFIASDRDISERRKLEAQLAQSQKMDAIGKLAGGVAHDFNNLLMVISAYAELMLDSLAAGNSLRRNVQEILTASRRAADLTRQLLAFGRKQMQALQVLDLNWVIQEVTQMLPRLIGEDIQLTVVPGRDPGRVKVDPVQIEQIILNLATNARDAMPQGGSLTIETAHVKLDESYVQRHSMVVPGEYAMVAVSDSGHGIPHEHQTHIFEPFYTTKEEGKGTGLGLATVYGIVKQNGGYIWVYSEPGMGTCFKIYLPCVQQPAEKFPLPAPTEEARGGSETILLVEDENAVRQSESEFLRLNGYTVLEAKDGKDAIRITQQHPGTIHLMVTDVVMPHMNGGELAQTLLVQRPAMRILFVSGYAENTVLRYGVDLTGRFLQKPFSLKRLARKIREALDTQAVAASAGS